MFEYFLFLLGVAFFSISGAIAAGEAKLDWVGVFFLAFVTSLGGGTVRDIVLNRDVIFWVQDYNYILIVLASSIFTIIYTRLYSVSEKTMEYADALGLALFSISGTQISEALGASIPVAILMGITTGTSGGIIRDIMLGRIPLLFRPTETLYSAVALMGILIYFLLKLIFIPELLATLSGIMFIAVLRVCSIHFNITVPEYDLNRRKK